MSLYENIHLLKKNKQKRGVPFLFYGEQVGGFLEFYDRCTVFVTGRATLGGKEALVETSQRYMSVFLHRGLV